VAGIPGIGKEGIVAQAFDADEHLYVVLDKSVDSKYWILHGDKWDESQLRLVFDYVSHAETSTVTAQVRPDNGRSWVSLATFETFLLDDPIQSWINNIPLRWQGDFRRLAKQFQERCSGMSFDLAPAPPEPTVVARTTRAVH
jgi:hypothetical protein